MAETKERLFEMFPPVSTEEWRAKVEADLKGAPFDKKLVWRTSEGFSVQPMYRAEDIEGLATLASAPAEYPYVRGTRADNRWLTRQRIEVGADPAAAAAKAAEILGKGVNSVEFAFGHDSCEPTAEVIATLIKDIDLKAVELCFDSCPRCSVKLAKALVEAAGANAGELHGSINFNPMRRALRHGENGFSAKEVTDMALELIKAVETAPKMRVLAVDSDMLSNAGAYIYQESGYALAWGAEWMTLLTDAGLSADAVASRIQFNMGVSSNFFMELAKFRAVRMLWAEIAKQYGASDEACKIALHATTSRFNQTLYDAHVNLLRSQTEAMSAALAGVDSITSTPFDAAFRCPDDFSERIARNQQLLLKEESHLDKVADPAGGSYYVETLTVNIAREAWKLFLEVEDNGGFLAMINDDKVQAAVRETNEKRLADVARRKEILLGTNQYPNINERASEKLAEAKKECGCSCNKGDEPNPAKGLPTRRASSQFDDLRLATEAAPKRPRVFMLTIGNLAMRLARAQFSGNFFGCAGYEIIDNNGFATVKEGIDAAMEKKADIVVLCSSDDEYAELAPEAFRELAGRAEFVVAGAPACMDDLKAAGINDFVHVRCNVLDVLRDFNRRLLGK